MQMKALRSAYFEKLSSSSSTSDEYWLVSISAGTPSGYCLSQMRSMVSPLSVTAPSLKSATADFKAVLSQSKPVASGGGVNAGLLSGLPAREDPQASNQ